MKKFLVVDDSETMRQLLIETLKDIAKCDEAEDGIIAFKKYNESLDTNELYDLILLDIAMPNMDGIKLLTLIREQEEFSNMEAKIKTPIFIVSAYPNQKKKAFGCGCDEYFVKPIDIAELLEKINMYLN